MKKVNNATALGDIVDLVMGQAPSSKDTNFEGRGTPFVKVGEFGPVRPVIHEWTTNPLRMARRTDVLLCVVGATCGKINLGEDCAIGRSVAAIRPHPAKLDQLYLYYFMMTLVERLRSGSVGAAQTVISKEMVETLQIPVPPLAEQQRIVGLLNETFEGLATAKANAEKNLQNASDLFESHLQSVFAQRALGWVEKKLSALYKIGSSKRVLKSEWKTEGVPFYRGREVTRLAADGFVKNELFISEDHFADISKEYGVPEAGDILITAIGTIGNAHVVRSSDRFYFKDASVLWMKRTADVSSEFIRFWLKSSLFFDQLDRDNGATVDTLTIQKLQSVQLRLPKIEEQKRVVNELDALSVETQRLARLYEQKLAALEELKKSLLHQAFTGEL